MAHYTEVKQVYGKHTIYSIQKHSTAFNTTYYVCDANSGKALSGSFDSLADAIRWAENRG